MRILLELYVCVEIFNHILNIRSHIIFHSVYYFDEKKNFFKRKKMKKIIKLFGV